MRRSSLSFEFSRGSHRERALTGMARSSHACHGVNGSVWAANNWAEKILTQRRKDAEQELEAPSGATYL
jgi:hypothetical protein